jgi:hypothetical protein
MMPYYPYSPVLGWSASRYQAFCNCKRQYYYRYYGAKDPDLDQEKLRILFGLTSGPLQVGNTVHDTMATLARRLQRTAKQIDAEKFLAFGRGIAAKQFSERTFTEVYYGDVAALEVEPLFDKIERCLRNFLRSRWHSWLTGDALRFRTQWVIEPGDYGETRIGGYKAYCKVDFAFPTADGLIHILEWKTGRPDRARHNAQLRGYVAYATDAFAKAPVNMRPHLVYLDDPYEERTLPMTDKDLDHMATVVREQTGEMYEYCADHEQNVPLPRDRFELTEQTTLCRHCNFRELCDR